MADIIRKVDYFKAQVQDKAGEGARILSALCDEGINLLFFTGFPRGRKAQLDFIPENGPAFRKAGPSGRDRRDRFEAGGRGGQHHGARRRRRGRRPVRGDPVGQARGGPESGEGPRGNVGRADIKPF
jgi:hypothetical protein